MHTTPTEGDRGHVHPPGLDGVDIAEDGTRLAFDENGPLLDNGYPAYGNPFVTQGYLYPKGTLDDANGDARGQVSQTALGFNAAEWVNSTVDIDPVGPHPAVARPAILRF